MTSGPFKSNGNVCTQKLEIVHMDLMDPIDLETSAEEKYALVMSDEFTVLSAVVLLRSKFQAFKEAYRVLKEWEVSHGCKVMSGQIMVLSYLLCLNTAVRTAPYALEQNGKVAHLQSTL